MRNSTRGLMLTQQQSKLFDKVKTKDPDLAAKLANVHLDWYRIKNATDGADEANIYIYDDIVPQWIAEYMGGVSAESMIAELNEITASTINVRINSPGGALFEAIAIYNALMSHSATINVYVDSLAASAASLIAMAGDKITMMVGSQMMIHDALGVEMGNAADMRAFATFLDKQSDNIADIYAEKSGGDPVELRKLMLAETWLFPAEAVALGLADEVYSRPENAPEKKEENVPDEEEPDPQEGESEEDANTDADADDGVEDAEDEDVENLMKRRHSLAARGFKHAGRKRAPAPSTTSNVDDLVAVFASFLGGK